MKARVVSLPALLCCAAGVVLLPLPSSLPAPCCEPSSGICCWRRARRGEDPRGGQLRQINVKGLTFSFMAVSKQPLQGEGGGLLSSCLSGCHLCFNLLLYFSKPNREALSCRFMLHFPFSPIAPPPFSASSVKESVHGVAQLHVEGLLSLVGCLVATLAHPFQAGWLFLCTFSFPYAVMLSWLSKSKGICGFNWEG